MNQPLFDTHAHLIADDWDRYPARPLAAHLPNAPMPDRPSYSVTGAALLAMMDAEGVSDACLVQRGHVYGYDNSYIIDAARAQPSRLHPVVILDAQHPDTPGQYRRMVQDDNVRGFRMAQARPDLLDTGWLCSPVAMEVWRACADLGTPLTLIVFMNHLAYQLPLIRMLARMFPDLPVLLDHGAMPYGMTQYEVGRANAEGREVILPPPPDFGIDSTIALFEDTANVYFKITEINMERLVAVDIEPARIVRRMVDSFGPDRLMWGSDIGQSMLWTYAQKAEMARRAAAFLTEDEARGFCHDNAARVYRRT